MCYVLVRNDPWNYTYHSSDLLLTAPRRASFLAQSVYGLSSRSRLKIILRRINRGGKIFAVLFPLTTILLLRIPQVQGQFVVFILLADLPRTVPPPASHSPN